MTTPIACATCLFWERQPNKNANWGMCGVITPFPKDAKLAHVESGVLLTRDVFYCALYSLRQQPRKYSIVDAAREAARNLGKERK